MMRMKTLNGPKAVILGDIDMLRPLALEGIPCAVAAGRTALPRYSRYAREIIEWADPWREPERLVTNLLDFGARQARKPVLFYESDADMLMVSRNRERLSEFYDFVVADAELIETFVEKLKFQELAQSLGLPVPPAVKLDADGRGELSGLGFPLIVKPLTRRAAEWKPVAGLGKALIFESAAALEGFLGSPASHGLELLAQECVPGPESAIESYHVYVDESGQIAGEFTGKKIRTFPREFGQSCALTVTDEHDVAELGRRIVARTDFRGVAKFDFKRDPNGDLKLLEINPRFNLWHHLGARAGVNLPVLVYCDLTGVERPAYGPARAGTNWCRVWQDVFMARRDGVGLGDWLRWAFACDARPGFSIDDPLPLAGAALGRIVETIGSKFRRNTERPRTAVTRGPVGATFGRFEK